MEMLNVHQIKFDETWGPPHETHTDHAMIKHLYTKHVQKCHIASRFIDILSRRWLLHFSTLVRVCVCVRGGGHVVFL